MTNHTKKWIRAGLETIIHGGAAAVSSSFTAALIDPKDWGFFTANSWKMIGGTFALNGMVRFFQWWQNNPLPPEDTAGSQTISLNPLAKVVTMTDIVKTP